MADTTGDGARDVAHAEYASALRRLEEARAFVARRPEDLELAAEQIRNAKRAAARLEEREKDITRPMREAIEAARALFRPAREACAEIEREYKRAIADRRRVEDEENARLLAEAQAAADAGESEEALALVSARTSVASLEGMSFRRSVQVEIVDPDAVPRELCSPDVAKIREAAKGVTVQDLEQAGGSVTQSGVRLSIRETVAART